MIEVKIHYTQQITVILGTPAAGGHQQHGVRSLTETVFIRSSPNLFKMFVGILSRPSLITSQITHVTFELWTSNYQKIAKLALSTL